MQTWHTPVHYAPSSVGALMDPGFLRAAALDVESAGHRVEAAPQQRLSERCRAVLRGGASFIRPRAGAATPRGTDATGD